VHINKPPAGTPINGAPCLQKSPGGTNHPEMPTTPMEALMTFGPWKTPEERTPLSTCACGNTERRYHGAEECGCAAKDTIRSVDDIYSENP